MIVAGNVNETEMNGVFYNQKENHIIFTQEFDDYYYLRNKNYIMLEEIEEKKNE